MSFGRARRPARKNARRRVRRRGCAWRSGSRRPRRRRCRPARYPAAPGSRQDGSACRAGPAPRRPGPRPRTVRAGDRGDRPRGAGG
ncbi:hypothetical protein FV217_21650 [Methylobacterium sp. WL9]|nr:hypothetical protein FV217_21650 [Methylobacterium sp. WL9]